MHLAQADDRLADTQGHLADTQDPLSTAHVELADARTQLANAQAGINHLYEQFVLARHRMFGASSEHSPDQIRLFDEAEVLAKMPATDENVSSDAPDDATGQGICACGTPTVEIGEEISEQLDIVPMKIQVLRHIWKRHGCPQEGPGAGDRADGGAADPDMPARLTSPPDSP